jgi:hypothetical protein
MNHFLVKEYTEEEIKKGSILYRGSKIALVKLYAFSLLQTILASSGKGCDKGGAEFSEW